MATESILAAPPPLTVTGAGTVLLNHAQQLTTVSGVNLIVLPTTAVCLSPHLTSINAEDLKHLTIYTTTAAAPTVNPTTNSSSPPLKPAKNQRTEDNEIVRCKRRLDFAKFGLNLQRPKTATVGRRNERERNRVKLINHTFSTLRQHLPGDSVPKKKSQKLSKVDTLRGAIEYIHALQELLEDQDAVNAAFSSGCSLPGTIENTDPLRLNTGLDMLANFSSQVGSSSQAVSPGADSVGTASSPGSSYVSSEEPPLSPDEVDLLDFTSWFQFQ